MPSEIDIVNLALTTLGAQRITSFQDNVKNAREANAVYAMIRDEVLRVFPWAFAKKRAAMSQSATPPAFGYTYAYGPIPQDCLRVLECFQGDSEDDMFEDWEIEGSYILTDEGTLNIRYISQVTDTSKFASDFVTALAARLAAELAWNITNSASLSKSLMEIYQEKINIAKASNSQEAGVPNVYGGDQFVQGRL